MRKIVLTDGFTLNPGDLNWSKLRSLGDVDIYDRTSEDVLFEKIKDAEIIIVNKQVINKDLLLKLPKLKCICVSATGVNNIDIEAAKKQGVQVSNVIGYSTPSVAQHVFALLLKLTNKVGLHHNSVRKGQWSNQPDFCYTLGSIYELSGLTLGIYGFGRIGQQVAKIGLAFGMTILAHHKHPERDAMPGVEFVDLGALFKRSNIISLHAPLTNDNHSIVNHSLLSSMPKPSFLINTGRGGLIHEEDLAQCLINKTVDGAALDVLSSEPPPINHPLLPIENCIVTPHIAWASKASRQRLLDETLLNVEAFLKGIVRNPV